MTSERNQHNGEVASQCVDGVISIEIGGTLRVVSIAIARSLAGDLIRMADTCERGPARILPAVPATEHLADPDVDVALFDGKTHDVVAVFQVAGGSRLRCLACRLEGQRLYQDGATAQGYARMLSGPRVGSWPRCAP